MSTALLHSHIPGRTPRQGKVRDMYDFGDRMLMVTSDRLSAFDAVLPTGIPDRGRVLTGLSQFWFHELGIPNHFKTTDLTELSLPTDTDLTSLHGRSMIVYKAEVVPIECVVRGYLSGSGWKEYRQGGSVCGITLRDGLRESDKLPEPIFTPATKEESSHDINIPFHEMCKRVGVGLSERLRTLSIDLYTRGCEIAMQAGIIIADTKFEFGISRDKILLIDEVLTPDSSRFWPADQYSPGKGQPSFDKQFVRDWLENSGWDKNSPPPELPQEIVNQTRVKYIEAFERITGQTFQWK